MSKKNKLFFDFLIVIVAIVSVVFLTAGGAIAGKTAAGTLAGLVIGAVGIDTEKIKKELTK